MNKVRRVYIRAAFHKRSDADLRSALKTLERYCLLPRVLVAHESKDHLAEKVERMLAAETRWPSEDFLKTITSSVGWLAMEGRSKVHQRLWRSIKHVDQRWPGYRLVSRLDSLVKRARNRLDEIGESPLAEFRRIADGSGQRAKLAKALLRDVRAVRSDLRAAKTVDWIAYESLLMPLGKKHYLVSEINAPPKATCYMWALELIIGDWQRELLLAPTRPFLIWLAEIGNPAYADLLRWDGFVEWKSKYDFQLWNDARKQLKKTQAAARSRKFRKESPKYSRRKSVTLIR